MDTVKQLMAQQLPHLKLLPSESPILCFQLESAADAIRLGQQLKGRGIFAPAVRPPTVPTSRIRISIMATHELAHIQQLVEALQEVDEDERRVKGIGDGKKSDLCFPFAFCPSPSSEDY